MKRYYQTHELETGGIMARREYGIKLGPELMDLLSSLYSDVPWAIVREYVTNAGDGHIRYRKIYGKEPPKPIEIHIPNAMDPTFSVKYYGIGMDHDTVFDVYAMYGESLKNDNNDEVGGLGMGAKCAFAYEGCEQWTILSRFNGKLCTYVASRNEIGMPTLTQMSERDTNEPNGVEVRVPIRPSDFGSIKSAVQKLLSRFPFDVVVTGDADLREKVERVEYTHKTDLYGWRKQGQNIANQSGVYVIMGGVPYPVDLKHDAFTFTWDQRRRWENVRSVDLFFGVGEIDFTPSREAIKYTAKSVEKIKATLKVINADKLKVLEDKLKACTSHWDKMAAALEFSGLIDSESIVCGERFSHWASRYLYVDDREVKGPFHGENKAVTLKQAERAWRSGKVRLLKADAFKLHPQDVTEGVSKNSDTLKEKYKYSRIYWDDYGRGSLKMFRLYCDYIIKIGNQDHIYLIQPEEGSTVTPEQLSKEVLKGYRILSLKKALAAHPEVEDYNVKAARKGGGGGKNRRRYCTLQHAAT